MSNAFPKGHQNTFSATEVQALPRACLSQNPQPRLPKLHFQQSMPNIHTMATIASLQRLSASALSQQLLAQTANPASSPSIAIIDVRDDGK